MTDKNTLAEAVAYFTEVRKLMRENFGSVGMGHIQTFIHAATRAEQLEKIAYYDVLSDDGETVLERHEYRKLLAGCKSERDQLEEENALQRLTIEAHNDAILRYQERVRELESDLSICQLRLDAKHTAITSKREAELEARVRELEDTVGKLPKGFSLIGDNTLEQLKAKLEAAKGLRAAVYGLLDGRNLGRTIYGWHELQEALATYDKAEG